MKSMYRFAEKQGSLKIEKKKVLSMLLRISRATVCSFNMMKRRR